MGVGGHVESVMKNKDDLTPRLPVLHSKVETGGFVCAVRPPLSHSM